MSVTIGPRIWLNNKEMSMLDVGASVPDFKLKSHEGEEISLGQYAGKWVVLHTFPFAFTGG